MDNGQPKLEMEPVPVRIADWYQSLELQSGFISDLDESKKDNNWKILIKKFSTGARNISKDTNENNK